MIKSKASSKKTGTKAPAKKKPAKKVAVKKKAAPKKAVSKKTTSKKTASTRQPAARAAKKVLPKKITRRKATGTVTTKQKIKKNENKAVEEIIKDNLPPVEEKSPEVNTHANAVVPAKESSFVPGLDKRSMQRAAARNYDNHHLHLSNRKGGIKPSGKKPLW